MLPLHGISRLSDVACLLARSRYMAQCSLSSLGKARKAEIAHLEQSSGVTDSFKVCGVRTNLNRWRLVASDYLLTFFACRIP